jgi:hypothetical protein
MLKAIYSKNKILFYLGIMHLIVSVLLLLFYPFNSTMVLGINSIVKPIKFALSIWIYSWTMAIVLAYVNDIRKVKIYSWVAVVCMVFEQLAITYQALRGELSHFNHSDNFGIILFSLMGIFILTITLWTAYITYIFIQQKEYHIPPIIVWGIKTGLIYFVVFSLFGGYISGLTGHTVGAEDGSAGLVFLNWSVAFGDLRVAHFFGIHSLQITPIAAWMLHRYAKSSSAIKVFWAFAVLYLAYVLIVMVQALVGLPFLKD